MHEMYRVYNAAKLFSITDKKEMVDIERGDTLMFRNQTKGERIDHIAIVVRSKPLWFAN